MDKLMDFKEIKKYLKVSRATMYRLVNEKKIPAFKVGRQWRFKKDRLDKWLEENENIKSK
ncbi:MAG: helix-turn-helix domain-containing protein [Omnitrophica bacterium]|nr:helix-turn-helix domain-containing protein [Candidatus Omnitrophota bacterium]